MDRRREVPRSFYAGSIAHAEQTSLRGTKQALRRGRGLPPMDFPLSVHRMSSTVITSYADESTVTVARGSKKAGVGRRAEGQGYTKPERAERKDFGMQILYRFFPCKPLSTPAPFFFLPVSLFSTSSSAIPTCRFL